MLRLLVTLLKLADNRKIYKGFIGILCLWSLFVCLACKKTGNDKVDKLNNISYAFHYRNLDSTLYYARKAYNLSADYSSGKAEALNNLAFVSIVKMDYPLAYRQLDSVYSITDNQIELLIADVQNMRLCQRQAQNRQFYSFRERAKKRLRRISEEKFLADNHLEKRLLYAQTEYSYVSSTYYYYVGLLEQSRKALKEVSQDGLLQKDTAQYLNWLYLNGSGDMIVDKSKEKVLQEEYDKLLECYLMARKCGFVFWQANAMQSLGEHLLGKENRNYILCHNNVSIAYLNTDNMPDSLLGGYLSQKSISEFMDYGDIYQTAGSMRTLAKCFWEIGDYRSAVLCLNNALGFSNRIKQAPDLIASIREQLSIVYSSLNDKYNSDINRNIYLDMQERTRQDMELDARADQLAETSRVMNLMILVVTLLIIAIVVVIALLLKKKSHVKNCDYLDNIKDDVERFKTNNSHTVNELTDKVEELVENTNLLRLNIEKNKRRNIENRSKVFLIDSVLPLIDRMVNEVKKLLERNETEEQRRFRSDYIVELSEKIDEYNRVLTDWIQLRKGDIGMHIESFPLNDVFDIVGKSKSVFKIEGKSLVVNPTDLYVKADRILTLFMINTIADNARRYVSVGGKVSISAVEKDACIEISVSDTGRGMDDKELSGIFDRKISNGHGFGLQNCLGIINKYKKYSRIFNVCLISAESKLGEGSRFFFRLPKGLKVICLLAAILLSLPHTSVAQSVKLKKTGKEYTVYSNTSDNRDTSLRDARAYADSAYFSNVSGTYAKTLAFADSALACLNKHYIAECPDGKWLLHNMGESIDMASEIMWFKSNVDTDYGVILDVRNESAVAALALHRWPVYYYNNEIYTRLFKEVSADRSLGEYCRIMQRTETNKNIAIVMLVLLFLCLLAVSYILYYHRTVRLNSLGEIKLKLHDLLSNDSDLDDKLKSLARLSKYSYAEELSSEISYVMSELSQASKARKEIESRIDTLTDEDNRLEYENERLYVSNNVLENCLSAIKHETMYYPSRIHQCIKSVECGSLSKEVLRNVDDLVNYYKTLYTALCRQLHSQIDGLKFRCHTVNLSAFIKVDSCNVLADTDMLAYLFVLLKKINGGETPIYLISGCTERYVDVNAILHNVNTTEEECRTVFFPSEKNILFLICRQIVREFSSASNLCGCGITACADKNGCMNLKISLPVG